MAMKRQPNLSSFFHSSTSPQASSVSDSWRCSSCTFDNSALLPNCEICESPRNVSIPKPIKDTKETKETPRNPFAEKLNEKLKGKITYLTPDAASWAIFATEFLPPSDDAAFERAWDSHPVSFHQILMFGKKVNENRWSQHWADSDGAGYSYSGTRNSAKNYYNEGEPGSDVVRDLAAQCNDLVDIEGSRTPYNACLQNWYEPSHTIGLHADDEKQMDNRLPIFSLSWGGTRRFLLRPKFKPTGEGVSEFFLTSGSLFVMGGTTQSTHKHEIPKWRKTKDPPTSRRVNYTMRAFERQEEGPVSKRRKI